MPDYIDGYTTPDNTSYDFVARTGRGLVRASMDNDNSSSIYFTIIAPGISSLYDGATFICKNTKVTSETGCEIDVNGLGGKSIWLSQANSVCSNHWDLDATFIFIFDEAHDRWELQQGRNTNTQDIYTIRPPYSVVKSGVNGLKRYSLYAETIDRTYTSFTTNATGGTGNKTYDTTTEFDITKIYYFPQSSDLPANSDTRTNRVTMSGTDVNMQYTLAGVTTVESTSVLQKQKPVYLTFSPTRGVYGKLVSPYYTQTLDANSATNVVYVLVGYMRDCYRLDLWLINHAYIKWVNPDDSTDVRILPWIPGTKNSAAIGNQSFVSGDNCSALGDYSIAMGNDSSAKYQSSVAIGDFCLANNLRAYSMGLGTIASSISQHVIGEWNVEDPNATYAEIVGNGTNHQNRSNARTIDWNGNETIAGNFKSDHHHYVIDKTVDLQKADNDVSSTKYSATYFRDKNDKSAGKIGTNIKANGEVTTEVYAQNFDTSGNSIGYNSVSLTKKKDGTDVVEVSNPQEWAKGVLGGYMRVYKATGNSTQYTVTHTQTVGNTSGYIRRGVAITYQQLVMFTWRGDTATIPTTASLGSGTCTITETNVNNTTFTFNISLSYTSWGGITLILFE